MFATMTDVGSTRAASRTGMEAEKGNSLRNTYVEGYHHAGSTRLSVVDGPGEGIETDRIGAEGRPYEDKEADKGEDSFAAKRLLADGDRMARSQPTSSGTNDRVCLDDWCGDQ